MSPIRSCSERRLSRAAGVAGHGHDNRMFAGGPTCFEGGDRERRRRSRWRRCGLNHTDSARESGLHPDSPRHRGVACSSLPTNHRCTSRNLCAARRTDDGEGKTSAPAVRARYRGKRARQAKEMTGVRSSTVQELTRTAAMLGYRTLRSPHPDRMGIVRSPKRTGFATDRGSWDHEAGDPAQQGPPLT